jgi:hypothetical protein
MKNATKADLQTWMLGINDESGAKGSEVEHQRYNDSNRTAQRKHLWKEWR